MKNAAFLGAVEEVRLVTVTNRGIPLKIDASDRFYLEFFALQRNYDFAAFRRCCPYGRFLPIALAVPVFGTAFFLSARRWRKSILSVGDDQLCNRGQIPAKDVEALMGFDPFLVQVEASSEFDLNRMPPELGASMARSGVASRVGNVSSGGVSP
jgi:hypothetical protein